VSVSAADDDDAVHVTVGASGVVTELRLADRVRDWSADRIAETILATMNRAQGRLATEVAKVAQRTVGLDSASGAAVVDGYATRFHAEPQSDE
jgi:hypothetical protein